MNFSPGDVLIVPFPHQENPNKFEFRPIIIVEDLNSDWCVVPLTSQIRQQRRYNNCFVIKKESKHGKQMGLNCDSVIIINRAKSIRKTIFSYNARKIGSCPDEVLEDIINRLPY